MKFILSDMQSENKSDLQQIIPVRWLEAKIQNMRKLAQESSLSININPQTISAKFLNNEEIILKIRDPESQTNRITNIRVISGINFMSDMKDIELQLSLPSREQKDNTGRESMIKKDLVMIGARDMIQMKNETLQKINSSYAVLIPQVNDMDMNRMLNRIFKRYIKDNEKPQSQQKLNNILKTIYVFISSQDYQRIVTGFPGEFDFVPTANVDSKATEIEKLMKEFKEWGGLSEDQILQCIKYNKGEEISLSRIIDSLQDGLQEQMTYEEEYKKE